MSTWDEKNNVGTCIRINDEWRGFVGQDAMHVSFVWGIIFEITTIIGI